MDANYIHEELNELSEIRESLNFMAVSFASETTYTSGAYFMLNILVKNIENVEKNIANLLKNE